MLAPAVVEFPKRVVTLADVDSNPKSIQTIYSWYNEGRLWVNRRYQRKLVWTQVEKQKLIESILRKYPVPAILLAERDTGQYEVIDGLQRLHTIISFIEQSFSTLEETYFDVAQFPTAKTRSDQKLFAILKGVEVLTPTATGSLLDYALATSVMRGASDSEIDDVFARINTYGHRLSDQERRQAGVETPFSTLVRDLACEIRGDVSADILPLSSMPEISIDLPMSKHGYSIPAEEVFWVQQGILRSTNLRDSMDEQCIADIAASIVGGQVLERSKEALDNVYDTPGVDSVQLNTALQVYGADRFAEEFKFCIDEVRNIVEAGTPQRLRALLFKNATNNPFPNVFAVLLIALHEALIGDATRVSNYESLKNAITDLAGRISTGRKAEDRRKNIDIVKGLISSSLVPGTPLKYVGGHSTLDIDSIIRRSEVELPHYELKQGLLRLDSTRTLDTQVIEKIIKTICAIANNGKDREGKVLIGVADKEADAKRIEGLDSLSARTVSNRFVVGVKREANYLGQSAEDYFARWKTSIKNSLLSEPLKGSVLSAMDYHEYFGLGLILITVPPQQDLSYFDGRLYVREGDETKEIVSAQDVASVARRFM